MEVKYELHSSKEDILRACRESVSHRLYVPGWTLRDFLVHEIDLIQQMVLARVDHVPVAISLIIKEVPYEFRDWNDDGYSFSCDEDNAVDWLVVFVRKKFRRKGIGSKAVKILRDLSEKELVVGRHNDGSNSFFNSLGNLKQHPDFTDNYIGDY